MKSKFAELLRQEVTKRIIATLLALLAILASAAWMQAKTAIFSILFSSLSKEFFATLSLLESLLLLISFVLYLLTRDPWRNYDFDDKTGVWYHRKTGLRICPSCKTKGIKSPMRDNESSWICLVKECRTSIGKPDHPTPPRPRLIRRESRWPIWPL